jgi:hypothetical protein
MTLDALSLARFRRSAVSLVIASGALPALAEVGPFAVTNVSRELVRAYNREDAQALHRLLAPSLKARYTVEAVRTTLRLCRVLFYDIDRISTPVWGGRRHGYFAVHAEPGVFEMHLEIDADEKIIHFMITDDLAAEPQQCRISYLD